MQISKTNSNTDRGSTWNAWQRALFQSFQACDVQIYGTQWMWTLKTQESVTSWNIDLKARPSHRPSSNPSHSYYPSSTGEESNCATVCGIKIHSIDLLIMTNSRAIKTMHIHYIHTQHIHAKHVCKSDDAWFTALSLRSTQNQSV